MPPVRSNGDGPRRLPFKPPTRVSSGDSAPKGQKSGPVKKTSTKAAPKVNRKTSAVTINDSDEDEDNEDYGSDVEDDIDTSTTTNRRATTQSRAGPSTPRRQSTTARAAACANPGAALDELEHSIPRPLLAKILHQSLDDKSMRVGKEAMGVLEMYMKVFVQEALARSRHESSSKAEGRGDATGTWLQVEDLEKAAPQLILDF
ncbi:hypothetical protein BT63DRAFT_154827 [Microthyrium microscopicum]|uniref:Centromere protein X n=1 Tax=Microthyrium microscopicum TaxID=703497 RepID=A0A6A6UNN8_9PEZI|nr:hypothetical protein BT63DRAFT_154827 [Microthyrium microscopicum]